MLARAHASSPPPSNLISSFFSPSSPSSSSSSSFTHSLTHSLAPSLCPSSPVPSSASQCSARLSPVCHCFAVSVERVPKLIVRSSSRPHRTTPHHTAPYLTSLHLSSCTGSPAPDRRTQLSLRLPRSNVGLSPARPLPRPRPLAGSLATADPQSKKPINPSRPLSSDPSNPRPHPRTRAQDSHATQISSALRLEIKSAIAHHPPVRSTTP